MRQNQLLGTWRLRSWENRSADGDVTHPLGPDAVGYLTYTADGYMFVVLTRASLFPIWVGTDQERLVE